MYYKEQNDQLIPPPVNFRTPNGNWIMNFDLSPSAMATYGWRDWTNEEVEEWYKQHPQPEPPKTDTAEFDAACKQFRDICARIGIAIDQPNFKGGFDEMALFAQSPVYSTIQGLKMAIAWAAANESCQHEAAKLGIYTPGDATWWWLCWEQESDSSNL